MKRAFQSKEINLVAGGKKIPGLLFSQLIPFKSKAGFDEEKRIVENLKAAFLLISGSAGNKLKLKLVDEQEIIMNMADMLAEAYIAESLLLRVQKLSVKRDFDAEQLEVMKKLLRVFLYDSLAKVRKSGQEAIASYASGFEKSLMNRLLKMLTPKFDVNPKDLRRAVADFAIKKNGYPFVG